MLNRFHVYDTAYILFLMFFLNITNCFLQEIVLDLIKSNICKQAATSKGFLIDGYPREIQQGIEFEKKVK